MAQKNLESIKFLNNDIKNTTDKTATIVVSAINNNTPSMARKKRSYVRKPKKEKDIITTITENNPKLNMKKESNTQKIISQTLPLFDKDNGIVLEDTGVVTSVSDGVAKIIGLKTVRSGEYVIFNSKRTSTTIRGLALNLEREFVLVAIFANESIIGQGDTVKRGYRLVNVPTGLHLLGRVIDALGNTIDGESKVKLKKKNKTPF
jgi:hypothetical protein